MSVQRWWRSDNGVTRECAARVKAAGAPSAARGALHTRKRSRTIEQRSATSAAPASVVRSDKRVDTGRRNCACFGVERSEGFDVSAARIVRALSQRKASKTLATDTT